MGKCVNVHGEPSPLVAEQALDTLRILLVGSKESGERIGSALNRVGHAVSQAQDMADATEALLVQRFDAVLLTGGMPEADLREFTAAVRELDLRAGASAHTPVLTTVPGDWPKDMLPPSGSGIDGVVPESIDADALTLAIARLASAVGSENASAHAAGLAPELTILDVEELKAQVAYDTELLVELIDLYLSERSRQSGEMAQALSAGDYDALSRIAHTIKGSLGSLHAEAARRTAQNVELAARDHDALKCNDFLPYLERQLDELEHCLLAVRQSLSAK